MFFKTTMINKHQQYMSAARSSCTRLCPTKHVLCGLASCCSGGSTHDKQSSLEAAADGYKTQLLLGGCEPYQSCIKQVALQACCAACSFAGQSLIGNNM